MGAGHDEESVESSGKDAISSVIAVSMSLIVIFASSITIIYLWKGEDGFVIERPSSALLSWQMEYMDLIGANNDSLAELDGEGVVVCVVDSGVDLDHPDLRGVELRGWRDSINGIEEPYDDEGHGTAMTGIIVSDGGLDGIAKGVELLVAKAINDDGQEYYAVSSEFNLKAAQENRWVRERRNQRDEASHQLGKCVVLLRGSY